MRNVGMTGTALAAVMALCIVLFAPGAAAQGPVFCAPPVPTAKDKPPPDDPPSCGYKKCEKCNASPCFAKTGVYTASETDLDIPTNGFPLAVTRAYESSHAVDGPSGYGWVSSLSSRIYYATYYVAAPDVYSNEAVVVMPDGEVYRYRQNADGTFTPPFGLRHELVRAADGTFTLTLDRNLGKLVFASDGPLLSMKDEYGNTLRLTLDAQRRVSRVDDDSGTGRWLAVTWNPAGRIGSVQDHTNRVVSYGYGTNGTLQSVTNPANHIRTYTYEQRRFAPLLSQVKDHWNRVITDVTWDALDRVQTYSEGGETYTMTYVTNAATPYTVKTHSRGGQSVSYDAQGLVTSRGSDVLSYSADGDPELIVDARGYRTRYTYTPDGRVLTATYGEGSTQGVGDVTFHYTYDPVYTDRITSIEPHLANWSGTAFNGNWRGWKLTYYTITDPTTGQLAGALRQVDRMAYQHQTNTVLTENCGTCTYATYKWDAKGRITSFWSRVDMRTTYQYDDAQNRLTVIGSNNGSGTPRTVYQYDSLGRTTSVTDPLGNVTSYEYDVLGRLEKITLPKPAATSTLNFATTYLYDRTGTDPALVYTHATDPNGRVTKQGLDQFGRLVEYVDEAGNVTKYTYAGGLLASITDAHGNVTRYDYDARRLLSKTTFPDGTTESYVLYGDGLLKSKTDRTGVTTEYRYDAHRRFVRQDTAGMTRNFSYEGEKLTFTTDSYSGVTEHNQYTYDPKTLLVTSEMQGLAGTATRGTVDYTWEPSIDRIATYSVRDGGSNRRPPITAYGYNADGSVNWMTWEHVPGGSFQFTYDLNGRVTKIEFPNGQTRNYTYDGLSRITQVANLHDTGNLATFDYQYDRDPETNQYTVLGQRTKVSAHVPAWTSPNPTTTYFYDSTYRLIRSKVVGLSTYERSWTYDAIGNRLTRSAGAFTTNYTYAQNSAGKNTQRLASIGSTTVTHDLNGNMTAFGGTTYVWDLLGRMSQSLGAVNYDYDFRDRRVAVDYESTKYIYNGDDAVAISYKRNNGYYLADYVFAPGVDQPLARGDYYGVTYYSVDALGSVILLSNPTGVVQNTYSYGAWGEMEEESGPIVQPFAYTGRELDLFNSSQRSLYHYRARRLMPALGRFLSEDPLTARQRAAGFDPMYSSFAPEGARIALASLDYTYAAANPARFTDPMGLDAEGCDMVPWCFETKKNLNCCYQHDKCFAKHGCTAWSWITKLPPACNICNAQAVCCFSGLCDAPPAPPDWLDKAYKNDPPPPLPKVPPPFKYPPPYNPIMGKKFW